MKVSNSDHDRLERINKVKVEKRKDIATNQLRVLKNEKITDVKYKPNINGFILAWLGLLLFLRNQQVVTGFDFGGYLIMGIGVILLFRGLISIQEAGPFDQRFGYLIGGGILTLIGAGAGITYNIRRGWWAFILICLGLVIVLPIVSNRGRNIRAISTNARQ